MKKLVLCIFLLPSLSFAQQTPVDNERISTVDSLKAVLDKISEDSSKVYVLKKLSREYRRYDSKLAMEHAERAYQLAQSFKMEPVMADISFDIGLIHYNTGDYEKAQKYFLRSLSMFESLEDLIGIGKAYDMVGDIKGVQGDLEASLDHYKKALKMFQDAGDAYWIAWAYNDIARSTENPDSSLKYHELSLMTSQKINNLQGIADSYHNMGMLHKSLNRLDTALAYLLRALALDKEQGNFYEIAISYNEIGALYIKMKKYDEGLVNINAALSIANGNRMKGPAKMAYKRLSEYYELMNNYEAAYENYQLYSSMKDSMFNEDKSKEIGKLEAKYEFEKAEHERKRLEKEQADVLAEAQRRRDNLQYSGILIFMVLLFAGVFMLGKFSIPIRLAEGMIFFSFLLFFEFTLVLLDPYIEEYSSGAPAIKLAFNAILAGLIFPLHSFFESKLKGRIVKAK